MSHKTVEFLVGSMPKNVFPTYSGENDRAVNTYRDRLKFEKYQDEHQKKVNREGSFADPEQEKAYIDNLIQLNLHAYFCFKEMDALGECLQKNGLVVEGNDGMFLNTNRRLHMSKCPKQVDRVTQCLEKKDNHVALIQASATHRLCNQERVEVHLCIDKQAESGNFEPCDQGYRRLLRCGLNHLWFEYFKAVNNIGEAEEHKMFLSDTDEKIATALREKAKADGLY